MSESERLIRNYYHAFNNADMEGFLALLSDDVAHDINQGSRELGKATFAEFMRKMNVHYKEQITQLEVMTNADGSRVSAEFVVTGEYLQTDAGLPVATGQKYCLAAGAFFEVKDGKITRVSNFYNLQDWIAQIEG